MKRQPTEWEKMLANDAIDKGLIFKIHRQLMQLNIKKQNSPIKKMGQKSKYTFPQRRNRDSQKALKKIFNITSYQRNANQNFTPHRMAIIKKFANCKCQRRCGKKGTLLHCWWQCKLVQPLWTKAWFLKKLKIELLYDPSFPLLGKHQDKIKI